MALEGEIKDFDLAEIIQLIGRTRKTGKLVVNGAESFVTIYFKEGMAVFASPAYQRDYLGNILARSGVVSHDDIEDALKLQRRLKKDGQYVRLGSLLVANGAIDRKTLEEYLRRQIEETVMAALTERSGRFEFLPEFDLDVSDVITAVDPEWVLLESSRQIDEWRELERTIPSRDAILTINSQPGAASSISLGIDDWRMISLINGYRTVEEVVNLSGLPRLNALRVIAGLLGKGVVTLAKDGNASIAEWNPIPRGFKQPPPKAERGLIGRIIQRIKKL